MLKNSGITPGPEGGGEILSLRSKTADENLKSGLGNTTLTDHKP